MLSIILFVILLCLSGVTLMSVVGRGSLSRVELVGLSFPVGMLLAVGLMMLQDLLRQRLSLVWVAVGLLLVLVAGLLLLYKSKRLTASLPSRATLKGWLGKINIVWLIFFVLVVVIEVMNFRKCMFFPTFDRDSLAGFDSLGYLIAQEHTMYGLSVFSPEENPLIHNAGSYITYAPLVQLSYSIVYMLGAETSKLIPGLFFIFFLISFYGVLRDVVGSTGAIIATFFVLITPEMIAFSSLSATNVIHEIYASLGVIYALKSCSRNKPTADYGLLWVSGLLLLGSILTRYDGIVFPMAMGLYLLYPVFAKRLKWWHLIGWGMIILLPMCCWFLHQKWTGMTSESIVITSLLRDGDKANLIAKGLWGHLTNTQLYGWSFLLLLISLLASLPIIIKRKHWGRLGQVAMAFVLPLLLYGLLLYHINYSWDSIDNVIAYSAKRYLFCFVPIALFCTFTLDAFYLAFRKVESWFS